MHAVAGISSSKSSKLSLDSTCTLPDKGPSVLENGAPTQNRIARAAKLVNVREAPPESVIVACGRYHITECLSSSTGSNQNSAVGCSVRRESAGSPYYYVCLAITGQIWHKLNTPSKSFVFAEESLARYATNRLASLPRKHLYKGASVSGQIARHSRPSWGAHRYVRDCITVYIEIGVYRGTEPRACERVAQGVNDAALQLIDDGDDLLVTSNPGSLKKEHHVH